MFKKLVNKIKETKCQKSYSRMTSPFEGDNISLRGLSEHALNLYEKTSDVKKFAKLALSDPENNDCDDLVAKLFDLSENEKFLRDLGL